MNNAEYVPTPGTVPVVSGGEGVPSGWEEKPFWARLDFSGLGGRD